MSSSFLIYTMVVKDDVIIADFSHYLGNFYSICRKLVPKLKVTSRIAPNAAPKLGSSLDYASAADSPSNNSSDGVGTSAASNSNSNGGSGSNNSDDYDDGASRDASKKDDPGSDSNNLYNLYNGNHSLKREHTTTANRRESQFATFVYFKFYIHHMASSVRGVSFAVLIPNNISNMMPVSEYLEDVARAFFSRFSPSYVATSIFLYTELNSEFAPTLRALVRMHSSPAFFSIASGGEGVGRNIRRHRHHHHHQSEDVNAAASSSEISTLKVLATSPKLASFKSSGNLGLASSATPASPPLSSSSTSSSASSNAAGSIAGTEAGLSSSDGGEIHKNLLHLQQQLQDVDDSSTYSTPIRLIDVSRLLQGRDRQQILLQKSLADTIEESRRSTVLADRDSFWRNHPYLTLLSGFVMLIFFLYMVTVVPICNFWWAQMGTESRPSGASDVICWVNSLLGQDGGAFSTPSL